MTLRQLTDRVFTSASFPPGCFGKIVMHETVRPCRPDWTEILCLGASNAGKSSLINALLCTTAASIHSRPGHTQRVAWYDAPAIRVSCMDVPGYGFALMNHREKVPIWIEECLKREALKRVLMLIDAQRGVKDSDYEWMRKLEKLQCAFTLVLTQCDTVDEARLEKQCQLTENVLSEFAHVKLPIACISVKKPDTIDKLRRTMPWFCTPRVKLATTSKQMTSNVVTKQELKGPIRILSHLTPAKNKSITFILKSRLNP